MPLKPRVMVAPQKLSIVTTSNSKTPTETPVASSNSHSSSGGEVKVPPTGGATGASVGAGGIVASAAGAGVGANVSATADPATIETDSIVEPFWTATRGKGTAKEGYE